MKSTMELEELNRTVLENHVLTNFACEISKDGHIFIISENEIKMLSFVPNMESDENKFKFDESNIKCVEYHIADHTGIKLSDVVFHLCRDRFYRFMMNEILTPKFENTNIQVIKPVLSCWSPKGVYRKMNCVLAVLSNAGNVEILIKIGELWSSVANFSTYLVGYYQEEWSNTNIQRFNSEKKSFIHENRVLECTATCMTWSTINDTTSLKYIYLTIGYINGCIRIWKIKCFESRDDFNQPLLLTTQNIFAKQIVAVHWCEISTSESWVICGDIDGFVKAVIVSCSNKNEIEIKTEIIIWEYEDIRTSKIISFNIGTHCFILTIKGQYIVLTLLDNTNYSLVKTEFINMGNLLITGIETINENTVLLTTYTGILKSLEIDMSILSDIKYEIKIVKTNLEWEPYCAKGLVKSLEGHLWGILVFPCKIFDHLAVLKPTELIFCTTTNLDPGKLLKENETQTLYNHWELLEIMRCLSMKKGTLPSNWVLQCDDFDDISLYELRIIYWLSLASYKFINLQQKYLSFYDKVTDPDLLEKIIYFRYHIVRLTILLDICEKGEAISTHQLNSMYLMKVNVTLTREEEYIQDYFSNTFLEEVVDKLIIKLNELQDIEIPNCVVCENPLIDGSCDHPDDRCIISHVQINCEGKWHCKYCNGMAHRDVEDDVPFCPICDVPLLPYDPSIQ